MYAYTWYCSDQSHYVYKRPSFSCTERAAKWNWNLYMEQFTSWMEASLFVLSSFSHFTQMNARFRQATIHGHPRQYKTPIAGVSTIKTILCMFFCSFLLVSPRDTHVLCKGVSVPCSAGILLTWNCLFSISSTDIQNLVQCCAAKMFKE